MHLPEAHELGVFQTGDQAQDCFLLAPADVGLEADQIIERPGEVILPKLDDGVGTLAGARIGQPDRAHRSKGERVVPARGDLLDGQAALEEMLVLLLEIAQFDPFGGQDAPRRSARTRSLFIGQLM